MATNFQKAFSAGELDPSLHSRVDFNKFYTGAKKIKNFIVKQQGGVENRAGTYFCGQTKSLGSKARTIPFNGGSDASYALEFGNLYVRVIKNGAYVTVNQQSITAITNANPMVLSYSGGDNYIVGDEIYISGISGDIGDYLNNRNFKIASVNTGTNALTLNYLDGVLVDSTSFGSYSSGGTIEEIYTIDSPYSADDVFDLQYSQRYNEMKIAHPSYDVRKLTRVSDTDFSFSNERFGSDVVRPDFNAIGFTAGTNVYRYIVTAVRGSDSSESLPWLNNSTFSFTNITNSTNPSITYSGLTLYSGDQIYIKSTSGIKEVLEKTFVVDAGSLGSTTTARLLGVDTSNYQAYSGGTNEFQRCIGICTAAAISSTNKITISWTYASEDIKYFNIYRADGADSEYGLVGSSQSNFFSDVGVSPDLSKKPPTQFHGFFSTDNRPSVVGYAKQRLFFAGKNSEKEEIIGSNLGDYSGFYSNTSSDDSSYVRFKAAGRKFNPVNHIVDLSKTVVLTEQSEIVVNPDGSLLTPTNISLATNTYNGSSKVPPLVINDNALYVQRGGSKVRDLFFDYAVDGLSGNDISIYAKHLFEGYEVVDWCYQKNPYSIVWAVRSDGKLLSLAYLKEQQVLAWSQHELAGGFVESCCAVDGNSEDDVYFVVRRNIKSSDGVTEMTARYVEKLSSRFVSTEKTKEVFLSTKDSLQTRYYVSTEEVPLMDSALSYDGRNFDTAKRVKITAGSGWTTNDTVNVESNSGIFSSSDVNKVVFVLSQDQVRYKLKITAYIDSNNVTCMPVNMDIPTEIQGVFTSDYAIGVSTLGGLWHLNGEFVSVLADGYVKHSVNNSNYESKQVVNGQISLDNYYSIIHVGLPIRSELVTLRLDNSMDEQINVQKVILNIDKTRGLFAGQEDANDMQELKVRNEEDYNSPVDLKTGPVDVVIESHYNSNGCILIRQDDPLPANISSITLDGIFKQKG